MIHREDHGPIALVRIEHGKANALDTELSVALADALDEVDRSEDVRALILTGSGAIFSAGVDLFQVLEGGAAYLDGFLPALHHLFRRLWRFPRPTVAAINGHAIAGGCIMACACDTRVAVDDGGRIGVPELRVGVPFPRLAFDILRGAVPSHLLRELVFFGRTYEPKEALRRGLVDELAEPDGLLERAKAMAGGLAAIPPEVFGHTRRQLLADQWDVPEWLARTEDQEVERMWSTPETAAEIRRYLERTLGKTSRD